MKHTHKTIVCGYCGRPVFGEAVWDDVTNQLYCEQCAQLFMKNRKEDNGHEPDEESTQNRALL